MPNPRALAILAVIAFVAIKLRPRGLALATLGGVAAGVVANKVTGMVQA